LLHATIGGQYDILPRNEGSQKNRTIKRHLVSLALNNILPLLESSLGLDPLESILRIKIFILEGISTCMLGNMSLNDTSIRSSLIDNVLNFFQMFFILDGYFVNLVTERKIPEMKIFKFIFLETF